MSATCFEPKRLLQEDRCVCSYGVVGFPCIGISTLFCTITIKQITAQTAVFLKMNPWVRNM
jgi:GTPase involved in cell partitioning and DNA repair